MAIRDAPIRALQTRRERRPPVLGAGETLARTFSVYFRYFVPVTVATAVLAAILLALDLLAIAPLERAADPVAAWVEAPESLLTTLGGTIGGYFLQGVFTFLVMQRLRGRSPGGFRTLGTGFARTVRALPTALVAAFVIGGLMFLGNWIGLLATVPAIIVGCGWFVAVPAAASEGLRAREALRRSWALTAGSKWRVFGVQIVLGILGVAAVLYLFFHLFESGDAVTFDDLRGTVVLSHVVTLPTVGLLALAAPVAYYLLRRGQEGIDIEELAAVFD